MIGVFALLVSLALAQCKCCCLVLHSDFVLLRSCDGRVQREILFRLDSFLFQKKKKKKISILNSVFFSANNTMFNQSFSSAQVPALFGASIAVFAIASTLFFFVHAAMDNEPDNSAKREAIQMELLDQQEK